MMQRRFLILIELLVFFIAPVFSQTHYHSNITLGAKVGADFSRIMFNPSVNQKFKPGAVAGLRFRYIEENHFGLIAEANFEQRGWEEDFENEKFSYSRTLNYIQIPVLAHIYFGGRNRFFFNAGPEIGFMLSDNTSCNFDINNINSINDFPIGYHVVEQLTKPIDNKIDYGISAGLGGEFNINRVNSVDLEVRFYFGLGNIFSSRRKDYFNASNSMSLMATVGYWFRIK